MPELPEVEVVRRGLEPYVVGRTFESVEVLHPRATRGQDAPLGDLIVGARVRAVARRGKYMWLELADEPAADPARNVVFIHLGMSGQLRVGHNDSAHVRIRTRLSGGVELDFIDQRTFGRWHFGPLAAISHIARDPLDPNFDIAAAARRITAKKVPIKTVLLDQTVVSGIGNIYADEALWLAGLDPRKRASALRQYRAREVIESAAAVMRTALAAGGTSFDSLYVNVNGESGYFSRDLNAYGRAGLPCRRCGSLLQRRVLGGRSTHYCSQCQTFG
ncbi:bifunctional DNA-formamidopyrimidine glycosylase/DNA-(apurinic or apyrimidinic site) lyase [Corynebacterium confusum]|uniref:bifunctional DNA-formamidopyrimidine glycosylase/DNA-(apurinic or apyrimidinic site) lyase n=1 Tax=uncultured Corynebacterium sp. TaxID=159447 RepID=UPI0025F9F069|nr:bifunctional DNA-formamidopyrimidine glycosylase/DNA-(apurinic or apyrimidinic site) lyase [uncultured Corynebacterium sp.]